MSTSRTGRHIHERGPSRARRAAPLFTMRVSPDILKTKKEQREGSVLPSLAIPRALFSYAKVFLETSVLANWMPCHYRHLSDQFLLISNPDGGKILFCHRWIADLQLWQQRRHEVRDRAHKQIKPSASASTRGMWHSGSGTHFVARNAQKSE